ncbi:magnesium/cobalt transporter CorA [Methylosinus sp. Sm6]|uniref:magnesium/cobalt transporter CorA n=1 Tax=Methylosinus sp. Sm6 TaxID=2866948 RepID=UPI001C9931B8|nr:magnesium/cobalt transporter CorA [Methylosinus sp. Sm6]MBY6241251.1 magnesium/cobalt transporter CorA [Methylosinus sp. Sm6]
MNDTSQRAGREPGVVAAAVYAGGRRLQDIEIDAAGAFAARPGHVVWIGLHEPSLELLARLQRQFDLHPLAIEDAGKAHQYPKLEQYGEGLFIVARTAQMENGRIGFGETHLFVGKGYVLSIRHGASRSYAQVRERCEAAPHGLSEGEDYIVYAILDFIVDDYFPVLATINSEVEAIEDDILARAPGRAQIDRLYTLRRDLLRLGNAVSPLVDVCQRLEHTQVMAIDPAMQPHFRDVTDHIRRARESIETLREVLAFAFEASLMNGQMQQTEVARRLAAWAAILAVPTAIAGIYGMNFEHMPELKWRFGYFFVLGAIAAICSFLYWRFRRNGWL